MIDNHLLIRPPPPPPPPLPVKVNSSGSCCKCVDNNCNIVEKNLRYQSSILSALRHITHYFYIENPATILSYYRPVTPIIQEGRCCGIVALSMASQLFQNTPVLSILSMAKSLNFTKEGEMFSAYNMATLASKLFDCDATVCDDLSMHKDNILQHICDGWPVLIPYDADKNHFPCPNKGHSAHWAVITGLCFSVSRETSLTNLGNLKPIKDYPELNLYVDKDGLYIKSFIESAEKIFLFAHQGKSRHLAAWDIVELFESNRNMLEVTKKYSSEDLVLPNFDALSALRNKAVLLKK